MLDPYLTDWLNLLIRFLHLVSGVAWIGASFYFVWLDNNLETPPQWKKDKGISGDLWAIHGGGFYEIGKYKLAPEAMPKTLHWFKWEAYTTAITGFLLLSLMFYVGAESYLIDTNKMALSQPVAIGIGIGSLVLGWLFYDTACKTKLVNHGLAFGLVMLVFITAMAYGLTQVFSDRGAFIHIGALVGISMALNVFRTIMPGQRALVAAVEKGEAPDPIYGLNAKLRSTHNNYATLPVLFIMISNHYPMVYQHEYNWLVLAVITVIGAWARHFFNLRHRGIVKPYILITAFIAFCALAWMIKPEPTVLSTENQRIITDQHAFDIIQRRCTACHSAAPTDDIFTVAQGGVQFNNVTDIKRWAPRIMARAVTSKDMPFMNKTKMTEQEREELGQWILSLNKTPQ